MSGWRETEQPERASAPVGVKLSRRLAALADWVPEGARFADIGADHALLPVYLAASGRIAYAVAGDVHKGPVEAARRQVAAAGLESIVSVRQGDGLSVLRPGEVDTVCIAGMGGSLMVRLLSDGLSALAGVRTLVLSPHVAEDAVRRWLVEHRYVLRQERLLLEDDVVYTLLLATRADSDGEADAANAALYDVPGVPAALVYEMGPLLLRRPDDAFRRKWTREADKREKIIGQLRASGAPEALAKAADWERTVAAIREVLA